MSWEISLREDACTGQSLLSVVFCHGPNAHSEAIEKISLHICAFPYKKHLGNFFVITNNATQITLVCLIVHIIKL